jgi:hypothetical protein
MEHGEETDLGAQMFRVSGDLQQGLGSCPKEQVIDDSLVLQRQKTELFRQSEDNMEIAHWQEFLSTRLHPLGSGCSLAFWTMTITARVVGDLLMAALIALFDVAAQSGSPTIHNVLYYTALGCRQRIHKRSIQVTEDIGQLQFLFGHDCGSRLRFVGNKSRGLVVERSAELEM